MATIVFVHGIAQQQYGAEVQENLWLPAFASGYAWRGLMPSRTVSGAIASVQKVSKPAWPSMGISSFLRISKGMPQAT